MLSRPEKLREIENEVFLRFESNVRSYPRALPALFERARGTELWDIHGRRYLDFLAGAGSLNYGHNNPVLKRALLAYIEKDGITHSLDLHTTAKEEFLEAIQEIILLPRCLDYVIQFCGPTGANSVEAALKIARKVTGRTNVIFFTNSFHGVSQGALSVTASSYFRGAAGLPLSGTTAMPYDGYFGDEIDTVANLDRMLSDPSSGIDHPAAVIVETVQGEGGLNTARVEWLRKLQTLCKDKQMLLIVDDIQAGCGRTGYFFSFELADLSPDIVTLSKSLSGYGLPLSIVLLKRELDLWKPGEHNGTFRGNNHAFVTATAMIRHYWRDDVFAKDVRKKACHLGKRLEAMLNRFCPYVTQVRGRGHMRGLRCADPDRAASITARTFRYGLMIERSGPRDEVIKCMMPLTTTSEEMDEGLDILEACIEEEFSNRSLLRHLYARENQRENQYLPTAGRGAHARRKLADGQSRHTDKVLSHVNGRPPC
jgi:diaminobutyrate-2-oxoglutarate transaminase